MNKNKKEKINIDEVNLLGEKPKVSKTKEPKVKVESKVKRETKTRSKK
jgi:hypothetical protein